MIVSVIPDIPIIDCGFVSEYRKGTVVACKRIGAGSYLLHTSLLDTFYVDKLYVPGQVVLYKISKKVIDGVCFTNLVH